MAASGVRTLGIGLQGGGSHAAFAWGVLDRLLDEVERGEIRIAALSGTSGGALNGAVCAYGMREGPGEAKRALAKLWDSVAAESLWPVDPYRSLLPRSSPFRWNVDWTPTAIGLGMAEQICSPYWNPWAVDPIGPLLEHIIKDFAVLNRAEGQVPKLFVCATDVNRTALRIFGPGEITAKVLMASTCYPTLYRAVEIDGSFYWDGGYMANPSLNPLVDCADDLLTILIDPLDLDGGPPLTPRQIVNRINEVSFGSSWVLEMRRIALINQLLKSQKLKDSKYAIKRFHVIRNDRFMAEIGAASKQNPSRDFIYELREIGREAADAWIAQNLDKIGIESSFDIDTEVALRLKGTAEALSYLRPPARELHSSTLQRPYSTA